MDMDKIGKISENDIYNYMETWFLAKFQDPANNSPYESCEGGYTYLYGGPFDAKEQLENAFGTIVNKQIINNLVSQLNKICSDWDGIPNYSEDYYYINKFDSAIAYFNSSIDSIQALLNENLSNENLFYNMLYVQVISSLELYLKDFFITNLKEDQFYISNFIKGNDELKTTKIQEIFIKNMTIEEFCINYLNENIIWHNLNKVGKLYKVTFNITFPKEQNNLYRSIQKRHDIVHRNGLDKDGNIINTTKKDVTDLIKDVSKLTETIETQNSNPKRYL